MLESIIKSFKKSVLVVGLTLNLYACSDTTIINNYFGRDGGKPATNDISQILDGRNSLDGFLSKDARQDSMMGIDSNAPYLDGGSPTADSCDGELSNYPEMFVTDGTFNGYLVIGENAYSSDNLAITDIATSMRYTNEVGELTPVTFVDAFKLDSEIASVTAQNLIVVGIPCYNFVAAELLGNPDDCREDFTPGQGRIKLFQHANGNYALLVAGYSGGDTRLAAQVLADRYDELSGDEVVVEGITASEATLSCRP